jgi:hypothetical protein
MKPSFFIREEGMTDKTSYIFAPSVQHTGTWFLINALKCHSKVDDLIMFREMREKTPEPGKKYILHVHVGDGGSPLTPSYHATYRSLDVTMRVLKTAIPLRDPLLSMLSRHKRHPVLHHFYLVDGFVYLATMRADCFFLPVDILKSPEKRKEALNGLFDYFGLEREPFIDEWAEQWKAVNENPIEYAEMEWYWQGAVNKLRLLFPKEFDYLQSQAHVIKPFLYKHGYKKLIW